MTDERQGLLRDEDVARLFHETYERLAPSFGYETRRESAVPWEDVPEPNRRLMVAVAAEVLAALAVAQVPAPRKATRLESRDLERFVILMENEGVVTWGDDGHRKRFLEARHDP